MKIKTSELTGNALDWAVAKCEGIQDSDFVRTHMDAWPYSINWLQGGPIIEREKIGSLHEARGVWSASTKWEDPAKVFYGKTKLIAAMRCYVASKLGDEVEVPDELVQVPESKITLNPNAVWPFR